MRKFLRKALLMLSAFAVMLCVYGSRAYAAEVVEVFPAEAISVEEDVSLTAEDASQITEDASLTEDTSVTGNVTGTEEASAGTPYMAEEVTDFKIRFNRNGGTGGNSIDPLPAVVGKPVTLPENTFTNSNYTIINVFTGWNTKEDGTGTAYADKAVVTFTQADVAGLVKDEDTGTYYLDLYAQWEEQRFSIVFAPNAEGVTGTMAEQEILFKKAGQILSKNAFVKTGYSFTGWNTAADGSGIGFQDEAESYGYVSDYNFSCLGKTHREKVTLYAQWTPIRYYIELNMNHKNLYPTTMNLAYDEEAALEDVSGRRPGYRVVKWTERADGTGRSYQDLEKVKNLTAEAGTTIVLYAQWKSIFDNPDGIQVYYRTQSEISKFAKAHPVKNLGPSYDVNPSLSSPYAAGKLKKSVQQDALNMLNLIRYSAGLSADVKIDSGYAAFAQAAALVNAANNQLSHYPSKPSGMNDALYETGAQGARSSNLAGAWGFVPTLASRVYDGWMADEDASNIDRVGHRRWVLNPAMGATGFGQVGGFSAMYAFDRSGTYNGEVSIWPAQNTPLEYFKSDYPWSYSSGYTEDKSAIRVKVVKKDSGKTWNFSSASSKDGYFNVENGGYGLRGCVIFRPNNLTINSQDEFTVTITGLSEGKVSYTVRFFGLNEGWKKSNGKWWYQTGSGSYVQNAWKKIEGAWYYFGGDGYMKTGWTQVGGKWYYMDKSGVMQTGWGRIGGKWYYMDKSGVMQTGWVKSGSKWYYMDKSGVMKKGWVQVKGKWYYMDKSGAMKTGRVKSGGKWYYMDQKSGAMKKGWVQDDGKWYYTDKSGVMKKGWVKSGGKWYYMDKSGAMVTDTTLTIDGKAYRFDKNGNYTNP